MNWLDPWLWLVPVAGLALFVLIWWVFSMMPTIRSERARELFRLQEERLADLFLNAARETGKPRGLLWSECNFTGEIVLAKEKESQQIHALVPIQIQFQAAPESDMMENPNVEHPRVGCAVFVFDSGEWQTQGKAIFNLDPMQALECYAKNYDLMPL
jgi:hypothetical protein